LNAITGDYTKEEVAGKIRLGGAPHSADPRAAPPIDMPEWGLVLSSTEISDAADYVISLNPRVAQSGCVAGFRMEHAVAAAASGDSSLGADARKELISDSLQYYQCLAVADSSPAECDVLKPLSFSSDGRTSDRNAQCRQKYRQARWARSLISASADYARTCVEHFQESESRMEPRDAQELCAMLSEIHGRPGDTRGCLGFLAALDGDASKCGTLHYDALNERICRDYARFASATRRNDADLCGDSGMCRVLLGKGRESCSIYAARAARVYCAPSK
jgi:hypothetical protein